MKTIRLGLILLSVCLSASTFAQNRTIDGTQNNSNQPSWGAAGSEISRVATNGYGDQVSSPGLVNLPNAREVSNALFDQNDGMPDINGLSDFCWTFGQFLDHDIVLVPNHASENVTVDIPMGDLYFDPSSTGTEQFIIGRSDFDPNSGTSVNDPRMNLNNITAWIDASNVYGSDQERADWLRTFANGRLRISEGNMLPFNTFNGNYDNTVDPDAPHMDIEGIPLAKFYVAGDSRANEQPTLIAMHTLFMREHNRRCDILNDAHPDWTDEEIYQRARKEVGALIQHIAYDNYLPALGMDMGPYTGYDDSVQPNILNSFSAAAFRIGHTQINEMLIRLDILGDTITEGSIALKDCFFNPSVVHEQGGFTPFLQGAATQVQQSFDTRIIHDLRNFMFGIPGAGGMDLATINIMRGRERGLPDYNTLRQDFGLSALTNFDEITSDAIMAASLETTYGSIDGIDPWVGMLSEDMLSNSSLGETMSSILYEQFHNLRSGDRFFYRYDGEFSETDIAAIEATSLADIIRLNTEIELIQDNVFFAEPFDQLIGLSENTAIEELKLYPNPTSESVTISWKDAESRSLRVYTNQGQMVYEDLTFRSGQKLDLSALQSGMYILRSIGDTGNSSTSTLIKN